MTIILKVMKFSSHENHSNTVHFACLPLTYLNRRFHGRGRHLGSGANAAKFKVWHSTVSMNYKLKMLAKRGN